MFCAPIARAATIDEDEFWELLTQTEQLLEEIVDSESPQATLLTEIQSHWQDIDSVRLVTGETLELDMRWLADDLTALTLTTAHNRVVALLDYHDRQNNTASTSDESLAHLDSILQDPRFQYPPREEDSGFDLDFPLLSFSPLLGQLAFAAISIAVVIAVIIYFARSIRFQPATVAATATDDPTTSVAANQLAASAENARDYRTAIRYLYLATLLWLDERGLLRYDSSLTNREHLRQTKHNPELFETLRTVVNTFERVWYGFTPVNEALYLNFRADVQRLRQMAGTSS